ncbi:MAG TPA: glycine radical domain-containing protein, partial [Deinococcales bacterium]|nr:glycine radical domain-containing protein [Deinococcales bacterium]
MPVRVHDHACRATREQATRVGRDSCLVVVINNNANVVLGHNARASADGRKAGEMLANGNNPTPGADREGVTAILNSLLKLDPNNHAGAVQNMKFSRELLTRKRPKLESLLGAYCAAGGTQAMITVVSPAGLEAAMGEPDKRGHLMVRVGGFSARLFNLEPDTQREIL